MKVSWCATDSSTHYFIEKESLDNPGKMVRWDRDSQQWIPVFCAYTVWMYEKDAYSEMTSLIGR